MTTTVENHPLIGKRVRVKSPAGRTAEGRVEQVITTRNGYMVKLERDDPDSTTPALWPATYCMILDEVRTADAVALAEAHVRLAEADRDAFDVCGRCDADMLGFDVCPQCLFEKTDG